MTKDRCVDPSQPCGVLRFIDPAIVMFRHCTLDLRPCAIRRTLSRRFAFYVHFRDTLVIVSNRANAHIPFAKLRFGTPFAARMAFMSRFFLILRRASHYRALALPVLETRVPQPRASLHIFEPTFEVKTTALHSELPTEWGRKR